MGDCWFSEEEIKRPAKIILRQSKSKKRDETFLPICVGLFLFHDFLILSFLTMWSYITVIKMLLTFLKPEPSAKSTIYLEISCSWKCGRSFTSPAARLPLMQSIIKIKTKVIGSPTKSKILNIDTSLSSELHNTSNCQKNISVKWRWQLLFCNSTFSSGTVDKETPFAAVQSTSQSSCIKSLKASVREWSMLGDWQRRGMRGWPEMEKRADNADISVLFFGGCANFLAVYAQTN